MAVGRDSQARGVATSVPSPIARPRANSAPAPTRVAGKHALEVQRDRRRSDPLNECQDSGRRTHLFWRAETLASTLFQRTKFYRDGRHGETDNAAGRVRPPSGCRIARSMLRRSWGDCAWRM